jgi:2,4-dienoyl-CoA reductase-like NADH-dependent reductase (Old Yellow Enzyme family)/thioredoxin reductase
MGGDQVQRDYSNLFSPQKIGSVTLRNRVAVTAHLSNFSEKTGRASDIHRDYYRERAAGGVGLIVTEGLSVHATALAMPLHARIDHDEASAGWAPVVAAVHEEGAAMFAQLNHVGRYASGYRARQAVWSSSTAPYIGGDAPHALRLSEIPMAVQAYAAAARRAERAGFDGAELHGGHGYLVSQFLSPSLNFRGDAYGGSFENRQRFAIEVLTAIRQTVSSAFVVGLRISGDEFVEGGIDLPLAIKILTDITARGLVDYVSVTEGNHLSAEVIVPDMAFERGAFRHLARGIRHGVPGVPPVFTVGRITSPDLADEIIGSGDADVVGMTRAHIADPYLVRKAAEGRRDEIRTCIGCNQGCIGGIATANAMSCLQNPVVGFEGEFGGEWPEPAGTRRTVTVVGAGPAGLEAAWVAAARGHRVTLLEASDAVGGQVKLYAGVPSRVEFREVITFRARMLQKFGVEVRTGQHADAAMLKALRPDHLIIATGCSSFVPPQFQGGGRALTAVEAMIRAPEGGERVLIYDIEGSAQAITVAEHLANQGCEVILAVGGDGVALGMAGFSRVTALKRMARLGVRMRTQSRFTGWDAGQAVLTDTWTKQALNLDIDTVVVVGYRSPNDELVAAAEESGVAVTLIGDAQAPRGAMDAIRDGHLIARRIG